MSPSKRSPRDFREEIDAHLRLEADRLRDEGVSPEEAEARARRAFGNVAAAEERFYEAGRWLFFDRLLQDLRQAWRGIVRSPAFAASATLSLGLGIGVATAAYGFVDALVLRPYSFAELERLVTVSELHTQQGRPAGVRPSDPGYPLATADYLDLRREGRSFQGLAAFRSGDFTLLGHGEAHRLAGRLVSPELFELLGVRAAIGRTFRPDEAEPGKDAVVVLSHALWQARFGGERDVVGRELVLNGRPHRVVGIMPAGFRYPPGGVEVWAPLAFGEADENERGRLSVAVVGRLAANASLAQARDELRSIGARLEQAHPRTNSGRSFRMVPLREQQAGLIGPFATLFQVAAFVVLLVACANVGSVLLARGLVRRRELALRAALGAGRGRVVRQLVTESLVISSMGLVLGLALAAAGVRLIRDSVPLDITKWLAGWSDIRVDARVLGVAVAIALVAALATGLSPAIGAARLALSDVLRHGARGSTGSAGRGRSFIVVAQLALSLVLVAGAVMMLRGFGRLGDRYEAYEPTGLLSLRVRLPESRYLPGRPVADFYERMLDEVASLPGVESAAAVAQLPGDLGPVPGGPVSVRGRSAPGDLELPAADYQLTSPDYFRVLRVRLLAGRLFDRRDGPDGTPVAVVSESMARRLWPRGRALGQQLKQGDSAGTAPWRQVVGVVEDVTQYWFDREPRSTLYVPQAQTPRPGAFVLVRTSGDAQAFAPGIRARIAALDPGLPLDEVRTLRQVVDDGMAILLLSARLLAFFAAAALALATLGIYGVVAHDVAARTPEIGVRLALGASTSGVRGLVLRRALGLSGRALLLGAPATLALGRVMEARVFGVVRPDPLGLALVSSAILAVGMLAALLPALRAAATDPASILRSD